MHNQKAQTAIVRIEDTNKRFLEDGAVTTDSALTISGRGEPFETVVIKDEGRTLETSTVNHSGEWNTEIFDYGIKTLLLTATGEDGVPSETWSINVVPASPVFIDGVRDSKGEIPEAGTTNETQITVNGRASPHTTVYVRPPFGESYGTVIASPSGTWVAELPNLKPTSHTIQAKAADSPVASARRSFTVNPQVDLGIDQVRDTLRLIENGGSTYDPKLQLFGWYSRGAGKVDIYDSEELVSGGIDIREGRWETPPRRFAEKVYEFIVKTPDGEQQSAAWSITVKPALLLTIDSVRDSQGEIADGGDTSEMQLQLRGRAPENTEALKIYSGDDYLVDATVLDDGSWTARLSLSEVKDYVFVAKTSAPDLSSNSWNIKVRNKFKLFIQSVRGNGGDLIGNPGETRFTALELTGRAEAGEDGYIVDTTVEPPLPLFPFQANSNNDWKVNIEHLEPREYHFVAKSRTRESAPWVVNIVEE